MITSIKSLIIVKMDNNKIYLNDLIKSLISSLNQTEDVAREHYINMFHEYCAFDEQTNTFKFKEYHFQLNDNEVVSLPEISLVEPSDFRINKAEVEFDCRMLSLDEFCDIEKKRKGFKNSCACQIEIELNPSIISRNRMKCTVHLEQTNTSESYLKILDALNNNIDSMPMKDNSNIDTEKGEK